MTTDELGFDRPGALTRYFAKRWLNRRGTKDEQQLIAWLLEAALGRNVLYFIERTKEYVDAWKGGGDVVPVDAFDGFVITGDPVEDSLIPHAVLVWTCMNDRPWPEEVYHDWLDKLLAAGSAEAAYLAASLWPAHDLMAKVTYRPPGWRVYRGQLDADAERLILTEILKEDDGPRKYLYGPFEYDDVRYPEILPRQYILRHGFTHPICGLVGPIELGLNGDLKQRIQEALAAPSWSEGVKDAAMLLYLSLKTFNESWATARETLNLLEESLFKLDKKHINIINFHMDKIEKIDYNLIKDYVNYLIISYNNIINRDVILVKILGKYISIGLRTKDILYIGKDLRNVIFNSILKEKEKVEPWLEKQVDDLRIKDIFLSIYMAKIINYYIRLDKELKTEQVEKKMEDIYGKIKYVDKIMLFIDQARKYFEPGEDSYKICYFINDILKRDTRINFSYNFIEDYAKIINSWHPSRNYISKKDMFLCSNHIGLYLYYEIFRNFEYIGVHFKDYINKKNELNVYLGIKEKITENLYRKPMSNIEKLNLYLNKIEYNNLPCEEIKYELIIELINIIKNNYNEILEYLRDENKMKIARKAILSNIDLIRDKFRDSSLIELFGIYNNSKNIIIY